MRMTFPDADWREVFNSASITDGGANVGNWGGPIASRGGYIGPVGRQTVWSCSRAFSYSDIDDGLGCKICRRFR